MTRRASYLGAIGLALGLAVACGGGGQKSAAPADTAQPGGPRVPVGASAQGDFRRDIDQIATGVADARANFVDDLIALGRPGLVRNRVVALSDRLGEALAGVSLSAEQTDALAKALLAAAGGDAANAKAGVEAALTAAGVAAGPAAAAGAAASQLFVK